ncbi:YlxR family protein [Canibacter zhoujuaniae]|uniref:YlxR family protein n=1 Tax=Canibacter zhoujuaniae TaxID=2708343 RepID=UPI0014221C26
MEAVRTCVGCRKRDDRSRLLRVVARNGALVIDERGDAAGRGCWLHRSAQCVNRALSRQVFQRALRVPQIDDTTQLENRLKLIMDHS